MRRLFIPQMALLGMLLFVSSANAGSITFFDLNGVVSDAITSDISSRVSSVCERETCVVTDYAPLGTSSGSAPLVNVVDPRSGLVSDTIGSVGSPLNAPIPFWTITFTASTSPDGLPPVTPRPSGSDVIANGMVQSGGTVQWYNFTTPLAFDDIQFQTNNHTTMPPAPEPTSAQLVALGVAGLAWLFFRRTSGAGLIGRTP